MIISHYSVIVRATTCHRARRLGVQGALLSVAVRVKLALDMQHYQLQLASSTRRSSAAATPVLSTYIYIYICIAPRNFYSRIMLA